MHHIFSVGLYNPLELVTVLRRLGIYRDIIVIIIVCHQHTVPASASNWRQEKCKPASR